eukprot:5025348-Amphidinium_carterae.2
MAHNLHNAFVQTACTAIMYNVHTALTQTRDNAHCIGTNVQCVTMKMKRFSSDRFVKRAMLSPINKRLGHEF